MKGEHTMGKQKLINPPGTEKVYEKLQFSQAVQVGDTIWVSGVFAVRSGEMICQVLPPSDVTCTNCEQ